jgi:hypothetical protein
MLQTAAALLFTGVLIAGCGRSARNNSVSGQVTVNGNPAGGATLTLLYEDGQSYPILIGSDGAFKVGQVPLGKATVTFSSPLVGSKGHRKGPTESLPKKVRVPAKYAKKDTSGLTWEITAGDNERTFDLKE